MAKFSHKLVVRYRFLDKTTSNVVKLAHSEEEAKIKERAVVNELTLLGHQVISIQIKPTKTTYHE